METLVVAVRVLISLAVVLGLLWFLHRKLSKTVRTRGVGNPITVSGRQNFGQKASVVVVDLDGQRFLLGVTEHSINVLHTGDIPEVPDAVFARTLADASTRPILAVAPPAARPAIRNPLPKGMIGARMLGTPSSGASSFGSSFGSSGLSGSVLSPSTWKQAATALRRAR